MRLRGRLFCPRVVRMVRLWGGRWTRRCIWRCRWGMGGLWISFGHASGSSMVMMFGYWIYHMGLGVVVRRRLGIADGVFHMIRSLQPMFRFFVRLVM